MVAQVPQQVCLPDLLSTFARHYAHGVPDTSSFSKTESETVVALPSLAHLLRTEPFMLVISPPQLCNQEDLHGRMGANNHI